MTTWNRAGALVAGIAVATALTACGGAKEEVAPAPAGNPAGNAAAVATPAAGGADAGGATSAPSEGIAVPAPVGAAVDEIFVVDHVTMADQPCHVMGNTVMGQCTDADIDKVIGETDYLKIDTETMKDSPCHVMDGTIMGACAPADIARVRTEHAIVVDTALMAEQACHQMDGMIMGTCTEDDVKRVADEIRAARPAAPAQP